jgi:hypothetical protein
MTAMPTSVNEVKLQLLRDYASEQIKGACQEGQFVSLSLVAGDDRSMGVAMNRLVVFLAEAATVIMEIVSAEAPEAGDGRAE